MDVSDPDIVFDDKGICNHCLRWDAQIQKHKSERTNLPWKIYDIKNAGEGKTYDCLIGLSGGVDSSLALIRAVEQGLRPLAFSVDNGWNDPKADENIMRLVEGLKVPFYRYTINLDTFRELQTAFLRGGIKNLEVVTDHILFATTYEMADKYDIKWVITGGNVATEFVMPVSWGEDARDLTFIQSVYRETIGKELTGLPVISLWREQYYRLIKGIQFFPILDYEDYNRENAIKYLQERFGWKPYGDKHQESLFTWWFQSFYLPQKYGIDKRKAHYASLILSGQMTRKEAMERLLESPEYPRFGIEEKVIRYVKRSYDDYKNSKRMRKFVSKCYAITKRLYHLS